MAKKILTSVIISIILFFCTSFCFATEEKSSSDNNKRDLGTELTDSMDKIEKSAGNVTNSVMNSTNNMMNNSKKDKNTMDGAITDNKMTSNYNTIRTDVDTTAGQVTANTGLTGTTWLWIILALVGIIILATVWFYSMQNNGND